LKGQASTQSRHLVHFSAFMVIAPPKTSTALMPHASRHGASDGWQFIQNKMGVSTFGVC